MERRILGVSYLNWIWSSGTTFTAYCFPGMALQRDFVLRVFVCSVNLKSLYRLPRRGLPRPTDTSRLPRRGRPRTDTFKQAITSSGLPHRSYHAPYKLLGTGGLSHLRVVFSYLSFHRLIRRCFHNNNHNVSTEPGALRTEAHNKPFPPNLAHTARTLSARFYRVWRTPH